jgi:GTP pyrophosphokinase
MRLSGRFEEALVYAAQLHATQVRKATNVPYISHLMAVSSLVLEHNGNEDEAIAALLHDAVEDQGGLPTLAEIQRRFGDTVAEIVHACSDSEVTPKPPWRARKEAYLAHLSQVSPSVRLVSAADKLHNARSILLDYRALGEELWGRFKGGKEGTLWYYRELANIFQQLGPASLSEELSRTVKELEQIAGNG